ncbi:MAG: dipeptidase [Candidatus Marinimicrobia bacterium]|nr:dipeptidase [Candidatus Neomarinimicrobiota bacterium]
MKKIIILATIATQLFVACHSQILKRAKKIHRDALTIDTHCDTPMSFMRGNFDPGVRHDPNKDGSKVDFIRMKEGGLDAQFFAAFLGQGPRNPEAHQKAIQKTSDIIDSIYAVVGRNIGLAEIATSPEDALRLEKEGKCAIYIGIENGYGLGNDLSNVKKFYEKGARYITLCHTKNNDICDSSTDTLEHRGLSNFGKAVVAQMNDVGMMIDVSHISDDAFYDVLRLSKQPVIASHSCARALCDNPRNLSDDMLLKIKENGGVIQMCILSEYVKELPTSIAHDSARTAWRKKYPSYSDLSESQKEIARQEWYAFNQQFPAPLATVSDAVDHIDHIVRLIGIDHVGIGTDFDGGGALKDCFDVSEMGNITEELVRRGYSKKEIEQIWGGNFMRVFKAVDQHKKI